MEMEVEIISRECIKPSSPTPHQLRNHKLSLLDQYSPQEHFPLLLYYTVNQEANLSPSQINHIVAVRLQLLKQSVSETLSHFYPLAGKIKDFHTIDCNDEGIYFAVAKVKSNLSDFLSHPNLSLVAKFLPDGGTWRPNPGNHVAGVRVTTFACGGIVVCTYISHMIVDGTALASFMKSWTAMARKTTEEEEETRPKFDASSFFPYKDEYPKEELLAPLLTSELKFGKFITKRFVFDASAIAKLKAKARSSDVENPTRVEVVTALFTKSLMAALKPKPTSDKPFLLTHTVNLRPKAMPQFSKYYMGNFLWNTSVQFKDAEAGFHDIVFQLKEGIAKVNADFVNSLLGDGGMLNLTKANKYEREIYTSAVDKISFASWCNFGLYDLDFGWGKPAWVSIAGFNQSASLYNVIVLMDSKQRNGIEAWLVLAEEDMATLQLDKELLALGTVDQSPLK